MEHLIETDLADLLGTLPCEFELNSCRAKFLILHLCCHTLEMSSDRHCRYHISNFLQHACDVHCFFFFYTAPPWCINPFLEGHPQHFNFIEVKKPLEKVFDFWHNPDHSRMLPLTLHLGGNAQPEKLRFKDVEVEANTKLRLLVGVWLEMQVLSVDPQGMMVMVGSQLMRADRHEGLKKKKMWVVSLVFGIFGI